MNEDSMPIVEAAEVASTPPAASPIATEARDTMNGKIVLDLDVKRIINFKSGFQDKELCDGPTFSTGTACVYRCIYCYVPSMMAKNAALALALEKTGGKKHTDVVARRNNALAIIHRELTDRHGKPRFKSDLADTRVVYSSPLVDVGANIVLAQETVEACKLILELTNWQIRLLSKSNLLPYIAKRLTGDHKRRIIYGVSTGTLDDRVGKAIELDAPLVSKRLASLYWLQDHGYRTFGMICPSLPQDTYPGGYPAFALAAYAAMRAERCENVWAEGMNARGEAMPATIAGLRAAGFHAEADSLEAVRVDRAKWEEYARATFDAHARLYPAGKLKFLQYVTKDTADWWHSQRSRGAIPLGVAAGHAEEATLDVEAISGSQNENS